MVSFKVKTPTMDLKMLTPWQWSLYQVIRSPSSYGVIIVRLNSEIRKYDQAIR